MVRRDITDLYLIDAIYQFYLEKRYAPTVRDICAKTSMSAAGIHSRLTHLREAGLVDWVDDMTRTLHVTDDGQDTLVLSDA